MTLKPNLFPALAALAALGFVAAPAHAQTYTEIGDAGQTVATAQNASTTTFTKINGTIAPTADDADLYRLYISSPATFSATTFNPVTANGFSGVDTELFLFDATGHAIAANDDDPGGQVIQSTLPAGNSLYKNLPAGIYYLGISSSGNEPTNGPPPNQLLFATGSGTAVRGPASGLNPTTLGGFDLQEYDTTTTGAYEIDFTGVSAAPAAAPEPSQLAAFAVGLIGLGALAIKARKRQPA